MDSLLFNENSTDDHFAIEKEFKHCLQFLLTILKNIVSQKKLASCT